MRLITRPRTKSCVKICLGALVAVSYALVILCTMWAQKRREQSELLLERFELPASVNIFPKVHLSVELPMVDKNIVKMRIENAMETKEEDENAVIFQRDKGFNTEKKIIHRGMIFNETDLRIISYPDENKTHFATFGLTTPDYEDYFYAFSAPLAVRAWTRIGYDCIVFIIGDINEWVRRDTLKHIYSELVSLHPALVFLTPKPENEILLSQACRLFAANYFSWKNPNSTFIVTSDVDIWPLNAAFFDIPKGKKIMALNSECCGSFDHGSHVYKLLPLANVVTDVNTWKEIINVHGFLPRTTTEIIDYFFRDFGPLVLERTRKDEYIGWYMDQRMVSMRLSDWMMKRGGSNVEFVPRDVGRDRLDVNYWMPYSLHGRSDVHILPAAYRPGVWEKIRPILKLMYSKDEEYEIVEYRETFMKHYIKSKKYTER